jgi:hypothetical protein
MRLLTLFYTEVHEDNNKAFGLIYTIITPEASEFSDTLLIGSGIGYLLQNLQLAVDENDNLYAGFYPVREYVLLSNSDSLSSE